ncbi:MAG TPA: class I SAM-dependent methyltransferase [Candidatus Levybacteria bacterium]|nr:class I SAM-dependent methyltransferase [Candidatus Levybacteria bacterium]
MKHKDLQTVFDASAIHRAEHTCGGYPYEYGSVLTALVAATKSQRILEFGTGLGYTAICLALGNDLAKIDTIDQDLSHIRIAQNNWKDFEVTERITAHHGKAEAILPTLQGSYDFIFFDGYAPSLKFLTPFDRLLKIGGTLVTANLFVKDPKGGKYLRALNRYIKWHTGTFADTAISVKKI